MKAFVFAVRALHREWRGGALRVLAVALVIAVASLSSVGFFTDRVRKALASEAGELLAADLVVASPDPILERLIAQARERGLSIAQTLSLRSVVFADQGLLLAEVKAAGPGYPLRGMLRTAPQVFAQDAVTQDIPSPGSAWLEARLMTRLGLSVGDTVNVGAKKLTVERVLTYEPDRGGDFFSIGPRLLMNLADIPATQLIQPGSRVTHALLIAGPGRAVNAFRAWLKPQLGEGLQLLGPQDARPELRTALERAERFLGLAALVTVLLAGVAVAVSARHYARRHMDTSAVLRCLGATQGFIMQAYLLQMLLLGLLASLAGVLIGYVAQAGLAGILSGLVAQDLPQASFRPLGHGLLIGLVTLMGFALPPVLRLWDVPPARVIRRELGPVPASGLSVYGAAGAAMAGLMLWQVADTRLALYVMAGSLATLTVLTVAAYLLVKAMNPLRHRVGVAWRFGLANIARRAQGSVAQVVAFGLGIMVLLLLSLVRGDLIQAWQNSLPPDAPNHFLINVQADQQQAVEDYLNAQGVAQAELYPMVRGRLVSINDRLVRPEDYPSDRAQRLVRREFNLSWADRLQADNRIVAGRWWTAADHGTPMLSVEQGLAETLGIHMDDQLTFLVAGREVQGRVTSLRSVEWDSFNVNFFVVAPPGLLDDYPATYITSFHLPGTRKEVLNGLVQRFPNITVIDVDALMSRVRGIMDRVSLAIEYVFLFTLAAGLVVLFAAVQATQDERRYESAILRTLGAGRRQVALGVAAEFLVLGALAGLLASASATAVGYAIADMVIGMPLHFNPWIWLIGIGGGALGVSAAGLLGTRSVVSQPPLRTLQGL